MKRILLKIVIGTSTVLVILVISLLLLSPKRTLPFKDKNGVLIKNSIVKIEDVEINGVMQRILIRGKDLSNPILLHIHGGPGTPDHPFLKESESTLEDVFTVCYWDQRGAGASYSKTLDVESMNLNQIVNDGVEISKYLKKKFNKEKIYVQGHSWGTIIGTNMVQRTPELFHAYFSIGQMANTKLSEQLSYDFTLREATIAKDKKGIEELKEIGRPPYETDHDWINKTIAERKIMRPYQNKIINKKESLLDIYKTFLFYKEYSIRDKISALKGDSFSMDCLWLTAININLFESIPEYKVPVYFFQGKHDKTTVSSIAKKYFDTIKAPIKKYYEFENSAHSPHIEEFDKYKSIIKLILKTNNQKI